MRLSNLIFRSLLSCALLCAPQPAAAGAGAASTNAASPGASPQVVFDALRQALEDNYPMLEYAGWRAAWADEFRTRVAEAPTTQAAFSAMDELVCRLNDYHTRFFWPGKPATASPPVRVEPVFVRAWQLADYAAWEARPPVAVPALDGIVFAVVTTEPGCGAEPGDVVVSADGVVAADLAARAWPHVAASSALGKLRAAADRVLEGPPGQAIMLELQRCTPGKTAQNLRLTLPRTRAKPAPAVSAREVDGIPVIRIVRWANRDGEDLVADVDRLLSDFRGRPGIVFDVRGNGGGQDDLASRVVGRFIAEPVISSISFHRAVPGLNFERTVELTPPRGPWRYAGRVAVLTDEGCMSACEHFVSGMGEAGALLCGTPTSGACGWIRRVDLPGGARVNVSRTFPLHTAGIPSPLLGIVPHFWQPRVLDDVRSGRDAALAAALAWIKSKEDLPVRLQPVTSFSGIGTTTKR